MKQYKFLNNILGLAVFILASVVYIITSEPTASYWDCGEYISTAYKLQVGHPPGAPFFQLMGRLFSMLAFGDVTLVARMINTMSALMSGLTILFLFWSITALSKKIITKNNVLSQSEMLLVFGCGMVGALAYTFSDSFWFSAAEGEVYAMSSFFTAFVFWAILKWEAVADEQGSYRWLVLIAFMVGLSIGVHLLNLLAIPAITMVVYFKKFKQSKKGAFLAFVISLAIIASIMYGIIPQLVTLFAKTELLFVNTFGLPFNSGTIIFAILITLLSVTGLLYTEKEKTIYPVLFFIFYAFLAFLVLYSGKGFVDIILRILILAGITALIYFGRQKKEMLKTVLLSIIFIIIGYSSFMALVIRSNANTPINENAPGDAISLLGYLNREQYGDWPVWYGPYFNAPLDSKEPYIDGNPLYARNETLKKYVVIDDRKKSIENYDSRFYTFFPRMWSKRSNLHAAGYRSWGEINGTPVRVTNRNGNTEIINKPTFIENMRFFFSYQIGHMYLRYFMWNFAGRQDDNQGHGILNGNWMSGIGFIDKFRLGPQKNLPDVFQNNKARNYFFFLPLLLGLLGFFIQLNKNLRGFIIVSLLFVFTGLAINVYLNPVPYQPRERDYAYAASFYAFSIWIGIGVISIRNLICKFRKKIAPLLPPLLASMICFLAVPFIMLYNGWDDHDRSGRTTARDIAANYLNSCKPNAILFTLGDNDTFPLWYAQEVEGIRTDVRVVNLNLLNMDWYINQMKRKVYDSEALPISLSNDKYAASKRDFVLIYNSETVVDTNTYYDVRELIKYAASDNEENMLSTIKGNYNFIPTNRFALAVDSAYVVSKGIVPESFRDSLKPQITWVFDDYGIQKNSLIALDIIANTQWKRPVYFAVTAGDDSYQFLNNYLQLEGLAYRLMPFRCHSSDMQTGRVNSEILYDNMMNKFKWGNMDKPGIYMDEVNVRMAKTLRNLFSRLAQTLVSEAQTEKAILVCDKCIEVIPDFNIPYDEYLIPIATVYFQCGETQKAKNITEKLFYDNTQKLEYFDKFRGIDAAYLGSEKTDALTLIEKLILLTQTYNQKELSDNMSKTYNKFKD